LSDIQPVFSAKIILSDGQAHSFACWLPVTSITSVTCSRRRNTSRDNLGSSTTRRAALKVILVTEVTGYCSYNLWKRVGQHVISARDLVLSSALSA
jgi:hypothetical protein